MIFPSNRAAAALSVLLLVSIWGCSRLNGDYGTNAGNKCRLCHAVPPVDRVHAAHTGRQNFDCSVCHNGTTRLKDGEMVPSATLHGNGTVDVSISALFNPGKTALFDQTKGTCQAVYCHGNFYQGVSDTVQFNDSISIKQCESCHDIQAMVTDGHGPHSSLNIKSAWPGLIMDCDRCHAGYSLLDSIVNTSTHVDGTTAEVNCGKCHIN